MFHIMRRRTTPKTLCQELFWPGFRAVNCFHHPPSLKSWYWARAPFIIRLRINNRGTVVEGEIDAGGRKEFIVATPKLLRLDAALFLLLTVWAATASAHGLARLPLLVRFTGTIVTDKQDNQRSFYPDVLLLIDGKTSTFRITKVQSLTGIEKGWQILQYLVPPRLTLGGPRNLIAALQNPEMIGKSLVIEGRLYTGARMLIVTGVEEGK